MGQRRSVSLSDKKSTLNRGAYPSVLNDVGRPHLLEISQAQEYENESDNNSSQTPSWIPQKGGRKPAPSQSLGGCKRGGGEERAEMVKVCSVFGGDAAF